MDEEHIGFVLETLNNRKGELLDMGPVPGTTGRTRVLMTCPSRSVVVSVLLITSCITCYLEKHAILADWLANCTLI